MNPEDSEILSHVEQSQEALRRSIEAARELAEESDRLIRQFHRDSAMETDV